MKTGDLIKALAADHQPATNMRITLFRVLPAALLVLSLAMLATLGIRADAMNALTAMAMKLLLTLGLTVTAFMLLPAAAERLDERTATRLLWIAPATAIVLAGADLWAHGFDGALARLWGTKALHCFGLIALLSALPLTALLFALRRGVPTRPAWAGAIAGLAAAGIGASLYALNCTEDNALFVACWYSLAALGVSSVGALIGSRLLRW